MTTTGLPIEQLRSDPTDSELETHRAGDSEDEAAEDIHTRSASRKAHVHRPRRANKAAAARGEHHWPPRRSNGRFHLPTPH